MTTLVRTPSSLQAESGDWSEAQPTEIKWSRVSYAIGLWHGHDRQLVPIAQGAQELACLPIQSLEPAYFGPLALGSRADLLMSTERRRPADAHLIVLEVEKSRCPIVSASMA